MQPEQFQSNSIFFVEVDRIAPNPYQPRREFDEDRLNELSESIRQYGVLQPIVVTRQETMTEDGGLSVSYELIAGERRLRASKLAGLSQIPVVIRSGGDQGKVKLELAIIENLQREDLNAIDRAKAFARLIEEFGYKHVDVGKKVGKSREYISNTLRLLGMPPYMQEALAAGKITEGHTRPLLMLVDRPDEQETLFKEILSRKLNVRESESIARRIATDRVRKKRELDPRMVEIERELAEALGTRVHIEQREVGGKVLIDYFSSEDLQALVDLIRNDKSEKSVSLLDRFKSIAMGPEEKSDMEGSEEDSALHSKENGENDVNDATQNASEGKGFAVSRRPIEHEGASQGSALENEKDHEKDKDDEDLYSVKNFSI